MLSRVAGLLQQQRRDFPVRPADVMVLIPARNEERVIHDTLEHLEASLAAFSGSKPTVVIVLNGCSDGTAQTVQRWTEENAARVRLSTGLPTCSQKPIDGKLDVYLAVSPRSGKVPALLEVERCFQVQRSRPEYVLQLDADTRIRPGDLERLLQIAREDQLAAVAGRVNYLPRDGSEPDVQSRMHNRLAGSRYLQTLSGPLRLCQSDVFVAAFRALEESNQGILSEDLAFTTLVRGLGLGAKIASDVPYHSLGSSDPKLSHQQRVRWMFGRRQWEEFFGLDALRELGLKTHPAVLFAADAWAGVREADGPLGKVRASLKALGEVGYAKEHLSERREVSRRFNDACDQKSFDWLPPR